MIKSHCRGGVLGRHGWEGRSLQLSMTQTGKWGGGSENAALMWLEFQGLNIIFRAALFPFTLIGAERTQAFFTFLQHLAFNIHAGDYQLNTLGEDPGCGGEIRKTV